MLVLDNLIARVPLLLRYLLAALVLCGLILAMILPRAAILRNGQEVRLEIAPVDPRDLFRGDYVVLAYRIGTVDMPKEAAASFKRGQQVFVTLRPDAGNKARKLGNRAVDVRYGLESYFVPQGEGKKIELMERARLEVVAAVAPS